MLERCCTEQEVELKTSPASSKPHHRYNVHQTQYIADTNCE